MTRTHITMKTHDGGKGDLPRPLLDREKFVSNWDLIFKQKLKETNEQSPIPTSTTNNEKNLQQTDWWDW